MKGVMQTILSNLPFFSLCFWQIFKCNIRQRGIYCNHFSVAKLFLVEFFVWIIFLFHMTKGQGFLMEGSGLHDYVLFLSFFFLSLSLCIRYNLWGTIQILWQLFYYLNFVYLLLLLFNFHDMKMNRVHGKYSFVSKFRSRLVMYIDYIYISIYYKYKIYVMFYIVF